MEGWIVSWEPAGRNYIDRVVTILPASYAVEEVRVVLRVLFSLGTLTLRERSQEVAEARIAPVEHASDAATRLAVSEGSFTLTACRARAITVLDDTPELVQWEEQMADGSWREKSYCRSRSGTITFDIE